MPDAAHSLWHPGHLGTQLFVGFPLKLTSPVVPIEIAADPYSWLQSVATACISIPTTT